MTESVLTIGTFDGVHLGHAALIAKARAIGDSRSPRARVVAAAFFPHPMSRLNPAAEPAMLSEWARREELLRQLGADEVERLEPTDELLALTPAQFVERMADRWNPIAFVEGRDFHFGKGRAGTPDVLRQLGAIGPRPFDVHIVEPVEVALCDQTIVTCSSSITRWLVANGRVADAARVLGRSYELTAMVVKGNQMGRVLGFPTANLRTECLIPADAVYAGSAHLPDGRALAAAIHVGTRSTFNDMTRSVEAHILGWDGRFTNATNPPHPPTGPQHTYDWPVRLSFVAHLRDQARFESASHLVAQIERDILRTRSYVEHAAAYSTLALGPAPALAHV